VLSGRQCVYGKKERKKERKKENKQRGKKKEKERQAFPPSKVNDVVAANA